MNTIDASIKKAKAKNRIFAIMAVVLGASVIVGYLSWLFLINGFMIKVSPQDADETKVISIKQGVGFVRDDSVYLVGDNGVITVAAEKYTSQDITLEANGSNLIEVELVPLPASVTITTNPSVDDMKWLLNGKSVHKGSQYDGELAKGEYRIEAVHPSYERASIRVTAEIAGEVEKRIELTPIRGEITLNSVPSGAPVSINGDAVGTTPVTVERNGGRYKVEINAAGYQLLSDTVSVTATQRSASRQYYLSPEQAMLTVNVSPTDGLLLINGEPKKSPVSVDANARHVVRYEKQGFVAESQTMTLTPAEQRTLTFELEPEMGNVRFTANETSDVFVNGKALGQTPLKVSLQTLPSNVEFKREGFRTVARSFTPSANKTLSVDVELLREFEARRKEGQPLFVETIGIKMLKVSPLAYTMGSPRNEVDRSPNEHPINVEFSGDIWVSRHEITEAQFAKFRKKGAGSSMPVTNVSWDEAAAFTNWLSREEGLKPFYVMQDGNVVGFNKGARGYRLPTEAEWEFIAKLNRRASPTKYVWGSSDRIRDKQGNFADESRQGQQTFILKGYNDGVAGKASVGSFKADRAGFYDLAGNVREWVHDFYSVVPSDSNRVFSDYLGVERGSGHVVKGASFKSGRMKELRTAVREGNSGAEDDIGFRIARYDQ